MTTLNLWATTHCRTSRQKYRCSFLGVKEVKGVKGVKGVRGV